MSLERVDCIYTLHTVGEMLPPAFTYFLDLSEFLRKYPHIALKLSEDEKHILQTFIEGKIEVEVRKKNEANRRLEGEKRELLAYISKLKNELRARRKRIIDLEQHLAKAREKIDTMKARIMELELLDSESRAEVRRLKHFRHEQEELEMFLNDKAEYSGMAGEEPLKPEFTFKRVPTFLEEKDKSLTAKLKLMSSQVHLSVNKMYYVQSHLQQLGYLEKRLNSFIGKPVSMADRDYVKDVKKILADTRKEKQTLSEEFVADEKDIYWKEKELETLREEVTSIILQKKIRTMAYCKLILFIA